ncbi:calcium-activated chloride channel regulator 2-like [Haliotis rubra]|uniref:calcium-activated chloride channel regulator 2-like n=1 Tax=Haliotis rubra TaxID=36100 RepID=UPI001EE575EE|nr:calcium-activated chloride channel regulator 2-like [Haliotis rubra]
MARKPSQGPGAFDVRGLNLKVDQFPPSPITDLVPTEVKGNRVTLQWTAPGDDWTEGTASEYEFRMWHDQDALRNDPSIGISLAIENTEGGKYSPSPSRTIESVTIKLSDSWPFPFYFIAVITRDNDNHTSELSNVVRLPRSETQYDIMSDPAAIFAYTYAIVYFFTRLIETYAIIG